MPFSKAVSLSKDIILVLEGKDVDLSSLAEKYDVSIEYINAILEGAYKLRALFPGRSLSWYVRSSTRVLLGIRKISDRHWVVRGIKEYGDVYRYYNVFLSGDKYICDCFSRVFGWYRKNRVCTHIGAVILARKASKRISFFL